MRMQIERCSGRLAVYLGTEPSTAAALPFTSKEQANGRGKLMLTLGLLCACEWMARV
jgi:hypothetical protein